MIRHELDSKEYNDNTKTLKSFLKGSMKNKTIGYSSTFGHDARFENIDAEMEDEIIEETIDIIATYGGYVYIEKNGEVIKEIELN